MKTIPAVCAAVLSMVSLFRASADGSRVVLSFDANGGELEDAIRVVKIGGTFGQNVNLYPSDSTEPTSSASMSASAAGRTSSPKLRTASDRFFRGVISLP